MLHIFNSNRFAAILLLSVVVVAAAGCKPYADPEASAGPPVEEPSQFAAAPATPQPDLSGRTRFGIASFYAKKFAGREMADGTKMDPQRDNAASRTLPLGTTAIVTNAETRQSAHVTIQDRGPYVAGRIVDLSSSTKDRNHTTDGHRNSHRRPDLGSAAGRHHQTRRRNA
jgi:rare lipoprotein A